MRGLVLWSREVPHRSQRITVYHTIQICQIGVLFLFLPALFQNITRLIVWCKGDKKSRAHTATTRSVNLYVIRLPSPVKRPSLLQRPVVYHTSYVMSNYHTYPSKREHRTCTYEVPVRCICISQEGISVKLLRNLDDDARTLSTTHGHHLLYPWPVCSFQPCNKSRERNYTDSHSACQGHAFCSISRNV